MDEQRKNVKNGRGRCRRTQNDASSWSTSVHPETLWTRGFPSTNKTLVCSPQIKAAQKVAAMELLDTCNLLLYDSNNNTLWQRFDEPTNILLPGQNLTLGLLLVSNLTSSDGSSGHYSLVLEQNSITFHENLGNKGPTSYRRWSFWGQDLKCPCSLYRAVLVTSRAYLQPVNNTGLNRNNSQVGLPLQQTSNFTAGFMVPNFGS